MNYSYNSSRFPTCHHPATQISYPENEDVCVDCGLVIEKIYVDGFRTVISDEVDLNESRTFLMDIINNANISPGVRFNTEFAFNNLRRERKLSSFKNRELICYCLYRELINQNVPRSPEEISYYAGVHHSVIWKIEKCMEHQSYLSPAHMLQRVGQELDIPITLNPAIISSVFKLEKISCAKPGTILGCAIMILSKKNNLDIDVNIIAESCGVSATSVKTLFKTARFMVG